MVRFYLSSAGDVDLIPGWGTKILAAAWCGQKQTSKMNYYVSVKPGSAILDKLLSLKFFRYKLERAPSHKVTSYLFLQNKLSPNLVVWNKHFICSWTCVFWAQPGGSSASLTSGPLTWLKSCERSPEAGWSQLASLLCLVVGGGCWLTSNLQWLRVFFNIEARFQKQKERGKSSLCCVYFISFWPKQVSWPNPESLWKGVCQGIDTGRHG